MNTATYETKVPAAFTKVRDLVSEWAHDVTSHVEGFDDCYSGKVEEVENKHRDGFIPFTDGGFDGIAYATMSSAHGSGSTPTAIQPYLDRALKDVEDSWNEENPEHPTSWLFGSDDDQLHLFGPSAERDHWREKFYEMETESLSEGGTYFYKIRTLFYDEGRSDNTTGKPEVMFCVGINTDFEYGRDHISWLRCYGSDPQCTKWLWEKTVPVGDITEELIAVFTKEACDALAGA